MKYYAFPESRGYKIMSFLLILAFLLLARDTMVTECMIGFYPAQFLMLGLMLLLGIGFLICNRREWKKIFTDPRMLLAAASAVGILLPMLVKRDWQMMYFSVLLCILFGIFVSYFSRIEEISRNYVLGITVLGLYSLLVMIVLRPMVDRGIFSVPVFYNARDIDFYNFGLGVSSVQFVKNRNFGIFREPGVYQYFLLLAVYLNNDTVKWTKQWQMWTVNGILALTMLSTFATGGVIELGLLAVVLFFDKKWYRDRRIRIAALALLGLLAAAVAAIVISKGPLYVELAGMVSKFFSNSASAGSRVESILVDAEIFFRHPLFGGGLAETLFSVMDNTTSSVLMFAVFGILAGCLHVACWTALVWEKDRSLWANLALLVILFMSFNTQNIIADVFFWLLPVMALVEKGLPLILRNRSAGQKA